MRTLIAALAALGLAASTAEAQRRGTPAPTLGVMAGYDAEFDALAAGAWARVPLPRIPVDLQAAGDFTFLDRLTDRQLALDVLWRVSGALAVGGGPVFRNSIYEGALIGETPGPRETRTGYSVIVLLGGTPSRDSPLVTGLQLRWAVVEDFRPQILGIRVGVALPF